MDTGSTTAGSSTKHNKGARHGLVIKLPAFILLPLVKLGKYF